MPESQQPALNSNPEIVSQLTLFRAWIESQMAYRGLPALTAAVVYDQDIVWSQGFGYADVELITRATPSTIFRIASITKLFTATAIMQLRDQGKLRLDDPVIAHLPWFQIRNRFPEAPTITIRHLITHTSGLPRESGHPYWTDFNFPAREEMISNIPNQETPIASETELKYSNLAFSLAGEIVGCASGQPYAEYVQTHILQPLGMTSTGVVMPDEQLPRLATGYGRRMPDGSRDIKPFVDCRAISPAAGMSSTAEDLARLAMLQFRDGPAGGLQILKGSTVREMHRPQWLHSDWQSGWALGFATRRLLDRQLVEHGGALFGYRTQISVVPTDKVAVIVMTNADDGEPGLYVDKALNLLLPAIRKAVTPPQKEMRPFDPAWERYLGKYRNAWGDIEILRLDQDLAMYGPWDPDPRTCIGRLRAEGERVFRVEGGGIPGELVRFEVDGDGKVVKVRTGDNYAFPIEEDKVFWGLRREDVGGGQQDNPKRSSV